MINYIVYWVINKLLSRTLILKSKQLLKSGINPVYLYHANVELTSVKNCHSNSTRRKYKPLKSE